VASFDQAWGRLKDRLFLLLKMIGDAGETAFVGELARNRILKQMASATRYQGVF